MPRRKNDLEAFLAFVEQERSKPSTMTAQQVQEKEEDIRKEGRLIPTKEYLDAVRAVLGFRPDQEIGTAIVLGAIDHGYGRAFREQMARAQTATKPKP